MSQHGIEHEFRHMTITESRKQLSPTIGRNPQQPTYRQGEDPPCNYLVMIISPGTTGLIGG